MGLRYGQGLYGQFLYEAEAEAGFQFKVLVSDDSGNAVLLTNNEILDLSWSYLKYGGCDKFSMTLKRQYDNLDELTATDKKAIYDVQVYITPTSTGTSTLYYRGFINRIRPGLKDSEQVIISGTGYGDIFNNIQLQDGTGAPKTYSSTTISAVVTSILNDFITGNSSVTVDTIDTFSTAVTSIKFNGTAQEAIQKLADIVGAEWGVDRFKKFYFRTPSTSVGKYYKIGEDISDLADELDYSQIVNRVYVEGGDVADVPYRLTKSDTESIANYGLREKRVSNSSVIESVLATSLANSILDKFKDFLRNVRIKVPFNTELVESTNPLPLMAIVPFPRDVSMVYGGFLYGTKTYGGTDDNLIISRIDYELRDVSLLTTIESEQGKPDFVDQFNLLNFELEQQRQAQGV